MASELRFNCGLENGLHARPASAIAEALRPFKARVQIVKESSGRSADARSVLSLVALDVAAGDGCLVKAEGEEAAEAIGALEALLERGLGEAVAEVALQAAQGAEARVPAGLRRLGVRWIAGRTISPGFAHGPVVVVRIGATKGDERPAGPPEQERAAIQRAMQEVRAALQARLDAGATALERDLLRAHLSMVDDPALQANIDEAIRSGASAVHAVRSAGEFFARSLKGSASAYVRERAIDVHDVCGQVLERLGSDGGARALALHKPSVIVADLLTPRQLMTADRGLIRALVLGHVGATSHTAILARARGIPALNEVADVETAFAEGSEVVVDADGGFVLPEVSQESRRYYAIQQRSQERRRARLARFAQVPARTRDEARLEIAANVSSADEIAVAVESGAEGVGLFRTEILFLDRSAPPNEQEQFAEYCRAIEAAAGRTSIIRTLDIGGDKPVPYLRLPREDNPFLGCRGIRLYERFPEIVRTQLRAIVRASVKGPIKVMAPMVTNTVEAAWFRDRVRQVQAELRGEGAAFDPAMPVGTMIEVPAAALAIDRMAEFADFFSIGTNDLCQYFMAVDRGSPRVAALGDPLTPAFLRLLRMIVESARRAGRWVGVCGEMAGEMRNLPLMAGLGVDEISVAPTAVLELKSTLASIDSVACRDLLSAACAALSADEVRKMLAGAGGIVGATEIVDGELVAIDSSATSKMEAIKELVGLMAAAGRSDDAHALEEAVWAREETYSTSLGFGFAVPHCKTDAVRAPTIAVARVRQPIPWGSTDEELVRVVIMLAVPLAHAARTHMQLFARLARRLMHEEFRHQLETADSPGAIVTAMQAALDG
jgi:fructose-specific PTS system IIA-like component